jgi:transcriptional regulator with XRE-family HTH domain
MNPEGSTPIYGLAALRTTGRYHTMNPIQQHRELLGLSVADLAKAMNVTPRTVERWEGGQCLPESHRLIELARVLDVFDLDHLMYRLTLPGATGASMTATAIRRRLLGDAQHLERVGSRYLECDMPVLEETYRNAAAVLRAEYEKMIPAPLLETARARARLIGKGVAPEILE